MKYVLTIVTFAATLWAVSVAAVFALIAFAGPHSGPLSKPMEMLVYGLAGGAMLVLPIFAASAVWRSMSRRDT